MATINQNTQDENTFIVGDKNQRHRQRSEDRQKQQQKTQEQEKNDLILENSEFEQMKNFVGPSYVGAGLYGMFYGIYLGTNQITFRNRPKKLIVTSMLNFMGKQTAKHANAGGCLCLIYSLVRKSTNYLFDDDMEGLSMTQKQMVYGGLTGMIFKSSRGYKPAFLFGTIFSVFCGSLNYASENKMLPKFIPL